MLGVNLLEEQRPPDGAEEVVGPLGGVIQEIPPAPPSKTWESFASVSRASGLSIEATVWFKVAGGCVIAASCSQPEKAIVNFGRIVTLGLHIHQHFCDQTAFITWYQEVVEQIVKGHVGLPHSGHFGPAFLQAGRRKVMMDVLVSFPDVSDLQSDFPDYVAVAQITRTREPTGRRVQRPLLQGTGQTKTAL